MLIWNRYTSLKHRILLPKIKLPSLPISTILRLDEAIRFLMLHVCVNESSGFKRNTSLLATWNLLPVFNPSQKKLEGNETPAPIC
jgi:hypothetical protein